MQEQISSSWRTITDPKAVKVLFDLGHRARLAPFFERAQTVSEVAERLQEDAQRLYYFVQRYVKLDLLEIARTAPRQGAPLLPGDGGAVFRVGRAHAYAEFRERT